VGLKENTVNASGHTGPRERFDEFGLAAARVALSAGKLYGVSHVIDDGVASFWSTGNERISTTRLL